MIKSNILQKFIFIFTFTTFFTSCSEEKILTPETEELNIDNYKDLGDLVSQDLSNIFSSLQAGEEMTKEHFKQSVLENISDPVEAEYFSKTFDHDIRTNKNIDQYVFTTKQQKYMNKLENRIRDSYSLDHAISILDAAYSQIENLSMDNYDKEVLFVNLIIFEEYFKVIKNNPAQFGLTDSNSNSKGFLEDFVGCMAQSGRRIARGAAWGALSGAAQGAFVGALGGTVALPGIGTAAGAVNGAVFGAARGAIVGAVGATIWSMADCGL